MSTRRARAALPFTSCAPSSPCSPSPPSSPGPSRSSRPTRASERRGRRGSRPRGSLPRPRSRTLRPIPSAASCWRSEAVDATRSVDGSVLPEAEEALHRAVTASRVVMTIRGVGGAVDVEPEGRIRRPREPRTRDHRHQGGRNRGERLSPFRGHDGDITDVAFSLEGSMLATTGDDGVLKVWDPETGALIINASGPGSARDPSFSDDEALVAAVWGNRIVRVVDLATGRAIRTFHMLCEGQAIIPPSTPPSVPTGRGSQWWPPTAVS